MSSSTGALLQLAIDGQRVEARAGETVLDVAQREGISIPSLCYLADTQPWGACRLCLIEVEGMEKLQAACTTWVAEGMVVKTDSPRVRARRESYLKMYLSDHNAYCEAPCTHACPTHIDIPAFMAALAAGDETEAAAIVRAELPFAGILGRICPRYCESVCRRGDADEAVAICDLHRAIADHTPPTLATLRCEYSTDKRVAVVGAGPAGLAAAWFLLERGHRVTLYDRHDKPGGLLRYAIPPFRLPERVIEQELQPLWNAGARFVGGCPINGLEGAASLLTAAFDAVIICTGSVWTGGAPAGAERTGEAWTSGGHASNGHADGESTLAPQEGISSTPPTGTILDGLELLKRVRMGEATPIEGKTIVLGDGIVALDAARTALRLGATEVTLVTAASPEELSQSKRELSAAREEGVRFQFGVRDVQALDLAAPGSTVIVAPERRGGKILEANPFTGRTPRYGIFAAGDCVAGAQSAIHAVASGKRTALAVDAWLWGEDLERLERDLAEYAALPYLEQLSNAGPIGALGRRLAERAPVWLKMGISAPSAPRVRMPKVAKSRRLAAPDVEVEKGISLAAAQEEAKRCLQCVCPALGSCALQKLAIEYSITTNELAAKGSRVRTARPQHEHPFIRRDMERCIACGRCVRVCRDVAGPACYEFTGRGFTMGVDTPYGEALQLAGCISCGRCVSVCPTGALTFNQRALTSFRIDEHRCILCGECVQVCPLGALAETDHFEEARQWWLELVAKGSRLASGHRLCAGCGAPIVVRQVLMAADTPVVIGAATGCLEVSTTIYPYTAWKDSFIHTAFENVAATVSGVETAYRALKRKGAITDDIRFIAFGGDGGTYDIGLQSLSGAMERGHRMLYVCYDNEAYMNTGFQRSGATPVAAWTTTSPVGKKSAGKSEHRKNLTEFMIAHGLEYVAQASPHDPRDLVRKAAKALSVDGPTFLNVLSPCPRGWRSDGAETIDLAREAVNTCYWPLFEYERGEYRLTYRPRYKLPLIPWLKRQGRFAHLFQPGYEEALARIEAWVDEEWDKLLRKCGEPSEAEWQAHLQANGCLLR